MLSDFQSPRNVDHCSTKLFIAIDLWSPQRRQHHRSKSSVVVSDKISSMNRPHEFHANRNLFSTNSNPKIGIQLLYQVDDGLWKANVVRFRNAQISDHIAIAFLFAVFVVERDSVFEVVSIYSQVFRLYNGNVGHVINWFRSQIAETPSTTKAEHLQCWKHSV